MSIHAFNIARYPITSMLLIIISFKIDGKYNTLQKYSRNLDNANTTIPTSNNTATVDNKSTAIEKAFAVRYFGILSILVHNLILFFELSVISNTTAAISANANIKILGTKAILFITKYNKNTIIYAIIIPLLVFRDFMYSSRVPNIIKTKDTINVAVNKIENGFPSNISSCINSKFHFLELVA